MKDVYLTGITYFSSSRVTHFKTITELTDCDSECSVSARSCVGLMRGSVLHVHSEVTSTISSFKAGHNGFHCEFQLKYIFC